MLARGPRSLNHVASLNRPKIWSITEEKNMASENQGASVVLAAMADGIGDLTFASAEWVEAAREVLTEIVAHNQAGLADIGEFTL